MSARNEEAVRRLVDEVIGGGRLELVDELLTRDYHDHDPANDEDVRGPEGAAEEIAMYRAAFPDLSFRIEDQLSEGDRLATRFSFSGTQRGELMGVPPSGRSLSIDGIVIHRRRTAASPRATGAGTRWGCCWASAPSRRTSPQRPCRDGTATRQRRNGGG